MTVREIYNYLDSLYPVNTACDFDNVGLLVGDPDTKVNKALVTLDCTEIALKSAIENGCQLIITHHPVIFEPLKNVLKGCVVYELINNGISVISMHTNLDIANGGVNDLLCKTIGLSDISSVIASDGFWLKSGIVSPITAEKFAERLKTNLGGNIRFADGGKPINNVLVCSGSGGEFVFDAINGGYDAIVTSEIKHHQFIVAAENGISAFDAGHFPTEDVVIEPLKQVLKAEFPEIEFLCEHTNLIKNI